VGSLRVTTCSTNNNFPNSFYERSQQDHPITTLLVGTMKNTRGKFLILTLILLVWFGLGTYWWLSQHGSIMVAGEHFLDTILSDWMVTLFISDLVIIGLLACLWVLKDAKKRGWSGYKRWGWTVLFLILGSPALFIYLALRPGTSSE
jgi:hypothetical protein